MSKMYYRGYDIMTIESNGSKYYDIYYKGEIAQSGIKSLDAAKHIVNWYIFFTEE